MVSSKHLVPLFDRLEIIFDPRYQKNLWQYAWGVFVCFTLFALALPSRSFFLVLLLGLFLFLFLLMRFIQQLQKEMVSMDHHFSFLEKRFHEKLTRLQDQTRLLSTMKEVSRVVNDDNHLENILEKVFRLLEEIAHPEEIVIWLCQENKQRLIPRAQRRNQISFFQEELQLIDLDDTLVEPCFQTQQIVRYAEGAFIHIGFPLVADQEALGVLTTRWLTKGSELQKFKQIQECEKDFEGLLKHLSLAIKKPTLYDRAVLDGLTGLFTKRHIQTQLTGLFHQARRNRTPLSLILIDIDHFKKVNDHHGHLTGDMILQQVAHLLKQNLRRSDSAYRYGGEELMVVLPGTTLEAAIPFAERIRQFIEKTEFETEHSYKMRVTVSMGICDYKNEFTDYLQMISRADQGLYLAKNSGRNRIGVYRQEKPELAA